MLTEEQKERITEFTKEKIAGNDKYHIMPHIMRVVEEALRFADIEKANKDVCWVSAVMHDICKSEPCDHGTEGSKAAEKFLLELGLDKDFVERVRDAIFFHNKTFSGGPIERQILWDADKFELMNIEGFKERLLPAFKLYNKDKGIALKKAIDEYYFFMDKFHTETAKKAVKKFSEEFEVYIKQLKSENTF